MWSIDIVYKVLEEKNDKWNVSWLGTEDESRLFKEGDLFKYEFKKDVICIGKVTKIYKSKEHKKSFIIGKYIYSIKNKRTSSGDDSNNLTLAILDHDVLILPKGKNVDYKYNFYYKGESINISEKNPLFVSECTEAEFEAYKLLGE